MLKSLAQSASLMLVWQCARAGMQGVWAIGLARTMGPESYGLFAGFAGLASTMGALTGLGFGLLMLQATSRDITAFGANWTRALVVTAGSAIALLLVYHSIAANVTGYELASLILIAIAVPELLCLPTTIIASYAFQAHNRMGWAGAMYSLAPAGNLAALGLYLIFGQQQALEDYLQWHLTVSVVVACLALIIVGLALRPQFRKPRIPRKDGADAAGYATMRLVDTGLASIDKTLVLRLAGSEIAGQYTAAYRLAALIALPAISLAIAVTPRLFRLGTQPGAALNQIIRNILRWALLLGVVSLPLAWIVAHALPILFGASFEPAGELARLLAPLPALLGLTALGCSVLMAVGRLASRIVIQASSIAALLLLMMWLVPAGEGQGAVYAVLLTYAGLAFALWWRIMQIPVFRPNPCKPM